MLTIYIPPVTHRNNQDHQFLVLDLAKYAVVSNTVSPQARQIGFQPFSEAAGILIASHPFIKKGEDALLSPPVEFLQLF